MVYGQNKEKNQVKGSLPTILSADIKFKLNVYKMNIN